MFNWHVRWRSGLTGLLLIVIFLSTLPLAAFGDNGDGTGNAQGIFKPLGLTSATLEDGTSIIDGRNIPLKPKITMHFDKNVVYLLYWERNKRCFHLYDENGTELALNLTKIDDTVDFSKRQYIWVEPVEALAPGTNYKLYVAPDLLAKNGGSTLAMTTNNQGVTINFKTAGEKTAAAGKSTGSAAGDPAAATNGASTEPAPGPAADTSAATGDSPDKSHTEATVNRNGAKTADTSESAEASDAAPNNTVTSDKNAEPAVAGSVKDKIVTGDSPVESNTEATVSRSNEISPGGSAAPGQADADKFAAMQQGRRVQNYVALAAGIILAGWVAAEFFRRRKRG
ncbi:hypothetical protein SAMN05660649_03866 [Desulfotomaculum arcticum]|uniref:SbsA Ig-like domain-containing protein n=1 Tax=Desulfotruncus arcticus DSM 17038 TaxID=1121424 RepID=A0A1I2X9F1_9FIRM|nr:hypothetical protein [Desulfotruncus arcticus]SFH10143.1 hypothetical protein SAMN05660649_03866 [Desulfotomaculum arcticum] [Desulfotruncus arcticus DSM 17038]